MSGAQRCAVAGTPSVQPPGPFADKYTLTGYEALPGCWHGIEQFDAQQKALVRLQGHHLDPRRLPLRRLPFHFGTVAVGRAEPRVLLLQPGLQRGQLLCGAKVQLGGQPLFQPIIGRQAEAGDHCVQAAVGDEGEGQRHQGQRRRPQQPATVSQQPREARPLARGGAFHPAEQQAQHGGKTQHRAHQQRGQPGQGDP